MRIVKYADIKKDYFSFPEVDDTELVQSIISDVRNYGDEAVFEYTEKYDNVNISTVRISEEEIAHAKETLSYDAIESMARAAENIKKFAKRQIAQISNFEYEITSGVFLGQRLKPIERVGVYVPGGRFPLVSSVLMGSIPAQVAGVKDISLFSPPRFKGSVHPAILVAAKICGVKTVYRVGGVQAIAAMAYGTETIKKVDLIVGPGNKYVAAAKKIVYGAVGIDFIAGPTEIFIIADEFAHPEIIAADLLAQAEHDIEAKAVLITTSIELAKSVQQEVEKQLDHLATQEVAAKSIKKHGQIILVKKIEQAVELVNRKAPEHLELHLKRWQNLIPKLENFGSLFIGEHAGEALGDYSSGINHTLPTNGSARYAAGLNVLNFIRLQTSLRVNTEGLKTIGPAAKKIAQIEGLTGHARSIVVRNRIFAGQAPETY